MDSFLNANIELLMKLTYYGHSCFGITINGSHLLFDPYITPNKLAAKIAVSSIKADYILISHGHADHVADVEDIANRTRAKLISNFEVINWFAAKGIDEGIALNIGGSISLPFGKVKYVNAIHSSSMPDGSYGGNPGGFVLEFGEQTIYYSGDTALSMDMQLIGKQFDISHAILPIGDVFTMGIEDALLATELIKCKSVIGMHYNTFPPVEIDKEEAKAKFESAGANLMLLEIGETIEL